MEANPTPRPTTAAAIAAPERMLELPHLKDTDGKPVTVKLRKVTLARMVAIREENPGYFPKPTEAQAEAARIRAGKMSGAEKVKFLSEQERVQRFVAIAAIAEPAFGDDEKGPLPEGVVPVSWLDNADLDAVWLAAMTLSGWELTDTAKDTKDTKDTKEGGNGGDAAADLGTFPAAGAEGSTAGG